MKTFKIVVLVFSVLLPAVAHATTLTDEFLTRCVEPLVGAKPLVSAGLVGPSNLSDLDIGVEGGAAQRWSWQFPKKNWTLGIARVGNQQVTAVRACGITVYGFEGANDSIVAKVMSTMGLPPELCEFKLDLAGESGFRSVVQKTKRGFPILINFSPLNDGGHVLMAWEVLPHVASSPCR